MSLSAAALGPVVGPVQGALTSVAVLTAAAAVATAAVQPPPAAAVAVAVVVTAGAALVAAAAAEVVVAEAAAGVLDPLEHPATRPRETTATEMAGSRRGRSALMGAPGAVVRW